MEGFDVDLALAGDLDRWLDRCEDADRSTETYDEVYLPSVCAERACEIIAGLLGASPEEVTTLMRVSDVVANIHFELTVLRIGADESRAQSGAVFSAAAWDEALREAGVLTLSGWAER